MQKFYTKDCPEQLTVSKWLKRSTDWEKLMGTVKPRREYPTVMKLKIEDFDPDQMAASILKATEIYGDHGWKSTEGESDGYTGFSLVYNPAHQDGLDPHSSTLGTPRNSTSEFFWNKTENHQILKNSYFDGYGFTTPTPASDYDLVGKFMARSRRTRVRSRLSILNGWVYDPKRIELRGWHKDEPIFENLRINIPVTTSKDYLFQVEGLESKHLDVGWAYTWNTHESHRVYNASKNQDRRIHFVLGYSPWWDYIPEEQAWVQNEFYGNKHPFDMITDGDVFEGLTLDETTTPVY
jgi:hypothetical protein